MLASPLSKQCWGSRLMSTEMTSTGPTTLLVRIILCVPTGPVCPWCKYYSVVLFISIRLGGFLKPKNINFPNKLWHLGFKIYEIKVVRWLPERDKAFARYWRMLGFRLGEKQQKLWDLGEWEASKCLGKSRGTILTVPLEYQIYQCGVGTLRVEPCTKLNHFTVKPNQ